jgi:hypothetical protein
MARCQSGGFIQEEERSIMAGSHHLEGFPAWSEGQGTDNSGFGSPVSFVLTLRIVQNTAITHQRAAFGHGHKLTKGSNPVLPGHQSGLPAPSAKSSSSHTCCCC